MVFSSSEPFYRLTPRSSLWPSLLFSGLFFFFFLSFFVCLLFFFSGLFCWPFSSFFWAIGFLFLFPAEHFCSPLPSAWAFCQSSIFFLLFFFFFLLAFYRISLRPFSMAFLPFSWPFCWPSGLFLQPYNSLSTFEPLCWSSIPSSGSCLWPFLTSFLSFCFDWESLGPRVE